MDEQKHYGCINQVFRPKEPASLPGWGDCTVCTPDPFNNPHCAGYDYVQITVRTYDVISIEAAKNPD
jgi:hypothetical protein